MTKDKQFLFIASWVSFLLILFNYPLFLKSISYSKFTNNQIKLAANKAEFKGFQKTEEQFWNSIKEVDLDGVKENTQIAQVDNQKYNSSTIENKSLINDLKKIELLAIAAKKKPEAPLTRFLFVGDSIMYNLGIGLQNKIQKSLYHVDMIKIDFKNSSGLNRIDFYDWYSRTSQLIDKYNPQAMVVIFGANDGQDILDKNGEYQTQLTPLWEKAYQERVERYAKLIENSAAKKVYWVGHPISNLNRYNKFFPIFNKIYQRVAESHPKIEFVDCWDVFAINSKFNPVVANKSGQKRRVRTRDGVHFTQHGANIIADVVIDKMIEDQVLQPKTKLESTEELISTKNF